MAEYLHSILDQKMFCPKCGWKGTIWDCEPDVDGDGSLGCLICFSVMEMSNA